VKWTSGVNQEGRLSETATRSWISIVIVMQ
jgi:hypothetical protein